MNRSELIETINAPIEQVWDVLFSQYGDIHIHNPTMTASGYLHGASQGADEVVRRCEFGKKLYLDEQITDVDEQRSFRVVVLEHNLPFVKEMSATYELSPIDHRTTALTMVSHTSFRPGFMKYLMRSRMAKNVAKHLFGVKYYIETGETVDADDDDAVFASYG